MRVHGGHLRRHGSQDRRAGAGGADRPSVNSAAIRFCAAAHSILKQFGGGLEHRNPALVLQAARALKKLRSLLSAGCLRARLEQEGH
jgi:hypothetical protein